MSDRAKILLVDDEPGMLRYIKTLLEVDNHDVETASTGEQALQTVEKGLEPDLVLLDLGLPDIDGVVLCRRLRAAVPDGIIVVLTARTGEFDVVVALDAGADDGHPGGAGAGRADDGTGQGG